VVVFFRVQSISSSSHLFLLFILFSLRYYTSFSYFFKPRFLVIKVELFFGFFGFWVYMFGINLIHMQLTNIYKGHHLTYQSHLHQFRQLPSRSHRDHQCLDHRGHHHLGQVFCTICFLHQLLPELLAWLCEGQAARNQQQSRCFGYLCLRWQI